MSMSTATPLPPEELQLLTWKLLDGDASETEQEQLVGCLSSDAEARTVYLQCVQLHVDLLAHFGGLPTAKILEKALAQTPAAPAKPPMPIPLPAVSPLPLMNTPTPF